MSVCRESHISHMVTALILSVAPSKHNIVELHHQPIGDQSKSGAHLALM